MAPACVVDEYVEIETSNFLVRSYRLTLKVNKMMSCFFTYISQYQSKLQVDGQSTISLAEI